MLRELKDKWFVEVSVNDAFPPQERHPGSQLQPYTDGNLVEPVIDGAPLMARFLPGIQVDDLPTAIIVIALLGISNALIWPTLIILPYRLPSTF